MPDVFTPEKRSWVMSRIRAVNTSPERQTGRVLRMLGVKTKRHDKRLPGTPDFTIPSQKISIFVHGCFWHQHSCPRGTRPSTNTKYWLPKLDANVDRFQRVRRQLNRKGWKVRVVWECQTRQPRKLLQKLGSLGHGADEN